MTAFKTILFMLLVPGLLLGILPVRLMVTDPLLISFGLFRWLATALGSGSSSDDLVRGGFHRARARNPLAHRPAQGTGRQRAYRFVRNPIYVGVIIFLLGNALWHPPRSILGMPVIVAVCAHLFVPLYEEPHLRKTFGAAYEEYCRLVPRWIPRLK